MAVEPEDPMLTGVSECYAVNRSASWYHPEHCHAFDHHEWVHAELERAKGREETLRDALDAANRTVAKAMEHLRAVYGLRGETASPELAARVRSFLAAADWHDALKNFMDGNG